MIRFTTNITQEQRNFLDSLQTLSIAEHIRTAVNEYIQKIKSQQVSGSLSARGGNNNG